MSDSIILALTTMQRECFHDFLDDTPRVIEVFDGSQWRPSEVCQAAMELSAEMEDFSVPAELTELHRAILKASVEKSGWLNDYEGKSEAAHNRRPDQMRTLRECAARLDSIGIEVNFMPI